jgi:hypothetical protein
MTRRLWALVLLIFTIPLAAIAGRYLHEDIDVDECVDVRHGSFDYARMQCDVTSNHPYVSYHSRHPHDLIVGQAASAAMLVSLCGLLWASRKHRTVGR